MDTSTCKVCFARLDASHEIDHEQWHAYLERRLAGLETAVTSIDANVEG